MQQNTAEKLKRIQSLFDEGKTHAEIAKELGYSKIESFYRYIYRYGDSLNYKKLFIKKGLSIVPNTEVKGEIETDEPTETKSKPHENISKAESIISLISRGMDIREVAKKKHFKDIQDMANYMKSKGYNWSSTEKNYVLIPQERTVSTNTHSSPEMLIKEEYQELMRSDEINTIFNRKNDGGCECLDKYGDILKLLHNNKKRLEELLHEPINQGGIPRYIIPGEVKTKSVKMINTLEHLMNDFCDVANITQKELIEVAVIEFLKKYGYDAEVRITLRL